MNALKWFSKMGCEKLVITRYKSLSDKTVEQRVVINEAKDIRSLQEGINQLPVEGDMMVKLGPNARYLTLEFSCSGKSEIISFYNAHIQTPATSFFSGKDSPDQKIWKEINELLVGGPESKPKWLVFSKEKNKVQASEFFSIEYLGFEDRTPKHVTASLFVESYAVIDNATQTKQIIEVRSGQLPPKPQQFEVAGKHFTLGTFKTPDGARLSPDQFIVVPN